MYRYAVGEIIEEFKILQDSVKFDIHDAGTILLIFLNKPTKKEIKNIKKGNLQFRMFVKDRIIFILSKFEGMDWMDAPYTAYLSKNLTKLSNIQDGEGYNCNIVLIDSSTGRLEALRLVAFSTNFSRKLKENIEEQIKNDFNIKEYDNKLRKIFKIYDTRDMVNYSEIGCRIRKIYD